jgi:prenyl protein peptidase
MAPFVAHVFCNHMGFPNFSEILGHPSPARYYVALAFVVGVILWLLLLFPLSEPTLYANDLYYS